VPALRLPVPASDYDLAAAGRAIAEPARAAMLLRMMDGQAHTARDLAAAARLRPSAATAHLRRLVDARLVSVTASGRQKLHTLASPEVATAIEALAAISPLLPVESLRAARAGTQLQVARACYSHLGGALSVAIGDRLAADGIVDPLIRGEAGHVRTLDHPLLSALAITELPAGSGPAVRGCLDWTEGAPHLAGRLGSAILSALLDQKWLLRRPKDRALNITDLGNARLDELGLTLGATRQPRRVAVYFGKAVDFLKNGVVVEVQFSNYPFLLNNLLRCELFFKAGIELAGTRIEAAVIVVKAKMFTASQSTLYYEQAVNQLTALAQNDVFGVPLRLVGLFEAYGTNRPIVWTTYSAARHSRQVRTQETTTATIGQGRRAASRAIITIP
jgi:DNA-binding transcriptional ArsR family regulator